MTKNSSLTQTPDIALEHEIWKPSSLTSVDHVILSFNIPHVFFSRNYLSAFTFFIILNLDYLLDLADGIFQLELGAASSRID